MHMDNPPDPNSLIHKVNKYWNTMLNPTFRSNSYSSCYDVHHLLKLLEVYLIKYKQKKPTEILISLIKILFLAYNMLQSTWCRGYMSL